MRLRHDYIKNDIRYHKGIMIGPGTSRTPAYLPAIMTCHLVSKVGYDDVHKIFLGIFYLILEVVCKIRLGIFWSYFRGVCMGFLWGKNGNKKYRKSFLKNFFWEFFGQKVGPYINLLYL